MKWFSIIGVLALVLLGSMAPRADDTPPGDGTCFTEPMALDVLKSVTSADFSREDQLSRQELLAGFESGALPSLEDTSYTADDLAAIVVYSNNLDPNVVALLGYNADGCVLISRFMPRGEYKERFRAIRQDL